MIFKQIDAILSGSKTQTRRVVKPEDFYEVDCDDPFCDTPDYHMITVAYRIGEMTRTGIKSRRRWQVGRTYAVQPGRGLSGLMWIENWAEDTTEPDGTFSTVPVYKPNRALFTDNGWREFRIRITAIRQERLQDITEADAKAEGVADVAAYRELWESINGKTPGARWADSPLVWVLTFEVVKERETQS